MISDFFPYFFYQGNTIESDKERHVGSSTMDKKNRKKRKRIDGGLGKKQRKLMAETEAVNHLWNTYLATRKFGRDFILKGDCQS
jgi:hypothetical protein